MVLDKSSLEIFIQRIEDFKDKLKDESNTRGSIIDPILQRLDWDLYDIEEVIREKKTSSGGKVDYELRTNGKKIYVEAKALNYDLQKKDQIQTTKYAYEDEVSYCVLTNGNYFQIFDTFQKVFEDRLILEFSLTDKELSIEDKVEYLNFISKNSVKLGKLTELNEYLSLKQKVREAIDYLLLNPNESFIELIINQIGEEFDKKHLKETIIKIGSDLSVLKSHEIDASYPIEFREEKTTERANENVNYLIEKLPKFKEIILLLHKGILDLGDDISERLYKKMNSVTFKRDTEFCTIKAKPYNQEIRIFFKFGEVKPEISLIKEIEVDPLAKSMRWGRVNYRTDIRNITQVSDALKLIKQCYDLQLRWRK